MPSTEAAGAPPAKRRKLHDNAPNLEALTTTNHENGTSLTRPISPPRTKRRDADRNATFTPTWNFDSVPQSTFTSPAPLTAPDAPGQNAQSKSEKHATSKSKFIASPVQLTHIKDMGPAQNVDAVGLKDILGDPLIKECWNFNFLFDLDFVMQHFDSDVRHTIKVKIVHGFWRNDDNRKIALLEQAEQYPNIELLSAYIPDPFGTHHTKMLFLFRHDDTVQIIVHTANMIQRDWSNMTQAVWSSPSLPLSYQRRPSSDVEEPAYPIGSGKRFQVDLIRYLVAYERRTKDLINRLVDYDFSAVRAAFIGSAPSRQDPHATDPSKKTSFGWLGLKEILSAVPVSEAENSLPPAHIVTQISSIATLGAQPTWLTHFQSILSRKASTGNDKTGAKPGSQKTSSIFSNQDSKTQATPKSSVIFPTPEEIRTSLDGYTSGGSIHWKLQSAQQQKQLEYMHPLLCRWRTSSEMESEDGRREAHRGPAAPHIKTYIRFSDEEHKTIDWVMVTSANLSKQAWGDEVNKKGEIRIQSWEAGVVVWPALFNESDVGHETMNTHTIMVPVFGRDMPDREDESDKSSIVSAGVSQVAKGARRVVGFRMPYDLPLHPYGTDEKPWCATMVYKEPDWMGRGYGMSPES